eukprot:5311488-Pyramimonas_sp.AAC.1
MRFPAEREQLDQWKQHVLSAFRGACMNAFGSARERASTLVEEQRASNKTSGANARRGAEVSHHQPMAKT